MKLKCPKCQNEIEVENEPRQVSLRCVACSVHMEQVSTPTDSSQAVMDVSENASPSSHTKVKKTKWVIGIVGTILLLIFGVGSKILENRTTKSLVTNDALLQQLGHDPSGFAEMPKRLDYELVFYIAVGIILLGYLLSISMRKKKLALLLFSLVFMCFLLIRLDSAFNLSQEERVRGFTIGGWVAKVGSELIPFMVEMAIISLGWIAIRSKQHSNCEKVEQIAPADADKPRR